MPPIRRSNRVPKPKVHWENPPPTRRRQPPAIIIYTDPSEDLSPEDLVMQPPEDLDSQPEDLDSQPEEDLDMQSPDDLDSQPEDLDSQPEEDLDMQFPEDLDSQPEEDLDMQPPENLDSQPEDLVTQSVKNQSYQPQFLSKDRAGRPQNMSENIMPVKLFQLFFTVKEIENIIKQINQQAIYIDFKSF